MPVHYETDGAVAVITIDRPDVRNAVDGPTAAGLVEAFRTFDADDRLAVAVLTGERRDVLRRRRPQGASPTGQGNKVDASTATDRWARRGCCSTSR